MGVRELRSLWKNRNFTILYSGQLVSSIGNNLFLLALPWFIYTTTHSRADMIWVGLATTIPGLVGLFSGVYVDRFPKRMVMLLSDLIRMLLMLLLAVFGFLHLSVALTIAGVFFLEAVGMFFMPASRALLPLIVKPEEQPAAVGFDQSSNAMVSLVSQAVGGVLYVWLGGPILFLLNAISFLSSIFTLPMIRVEEKIEKRAHASFFSDWKAGLQTMYQSNLFFWISISAMIFNIGTAGLSILLPMWIKTGLHLNASWLGVMMGAIALGDVVGGLFIGALTKIFSFQQGILLGGFTISIFFAGIGIVPNPYADTIFLFIGSMGGALMMSVTALKLMSAPGTLRGRLFATMNGFARLMTPLGMVLVGVLSMYMDLRWVFVICGALVVMGLLRMIFPIRDDMANLQIKADSEAVITESSIGEDPVVES